MTARQQSVPAWFGERVRRERENLGLSIRQLAVKCGIANSTVSRAEEGHDLALSSALALAAVLDRPLAALLAEPSCPVCDGTPPAGFACTSCGTGMPA
jgi:transcriptional regulator with XRE-family HTH domain